MAFDAASPALAPPPADPAGPHAATSCFDLLLIELVPMAYRLAAEVEGRALAAAGHGAASAGGGAAAAAGAGAVAGTEAKGGLGVGGIGGAVAGMDDEETREVVFWRLDAVGYRVGLGIVDKFARDKPRFTDTLDVIKFICKDIWIMVFKKQIDNLKTNHRGVYVLTDNSFKPLSRMSLEHGREGMMAQAQPFLYFPAGVIRGVLASLGIVATVQAESGALPGATFQIRTISRP